MVHPRFWIAAIAAAAFAGAACHAKPPAAPAAAVASPAPTPTRTAPPPPPPPRPDVTRTGPAPAAPSADDLFRQMTLDQLNSKHPLGDAFFDYDQFSLREDARTALATDADWLKHWPGTDILVEGHADERGTAEYNLALGKSRARAVEEYLVSLGIPQNRIKVDSLGKDAPFCTQDNEGCWSKNRRGHFIITAK
jgi:peptidoglycan-associated lipoprotein